MEKDNLNEQNYPEFLSNQIHDDHELNKRYTELIEKYTESENRFWSFFYGNDSVKLLIDPASGYIIDANEYALKFYNYTKSDLLNKKIYDICVLPVHIIDIEIERSLYDWYKQFNFQHKLASGALREVEVTSGPINKNDKKYILNIIQDISHKKRLEESLWHETRFKINNDTNINYTNYDELLDNITTQVWYFLDSETYGNVNKAHADFLGLNKVSIEEQRIYNVLDTEAAESIVSENRKVIQNKREILTERWIKNCAGEERLLSITRIPKIDRNDKVEYIVCTAEDITDRHRRIEELKELLVKRESQALIDALTGIPNRRCFDSFLHREWGRAKRESACISLLMIDIDHFKAFNDLYGHKAGDDCLVQIAQVLTSSVNRSTDLVARYGGEEFAAVLPKTDAKGAARIVELMRQKVYELELRHEDSPVHQVITVSIGSATIVPLMSLAEVNEDVLINSADQTLYEAKRNGRNAVTIQDLRFDGKNTLYGEHALKE